MRRLEFDAGRFDAVTAFFSLLMLSRVEIAAMLGLIRTWLAPKGYLALGMVEFDADSVPVEFMGVTFPVSGYSAAGLSTLLVECGFEVLSLEPVTHQPVDGQAEPQVFGLARPAV